MLVAGLSLFVSVSLGWCVVVNRITEVEEEEEHRDPSFVTMS